MTYNTEAAHQHWEGRYQAGMTGWDRGTSSHNLQRWLDSGHLTPCRILVPGCGNGYEVLQLARLGFEVTAIDIAETPIKNLQQALAENSLTATVLQQDFFTYQPDTPFAAIYEQTSLCALPPETWQTYVKCLHSWLQPGGKLFAQFMQTGQAGGPPWHCPLDSMQALFTDTDWAWQDALTAQAMKANDPKFELPHLLIRRN